MRHVIASGLLLIIATLCVAQIAQRSTPARSSAKPAATEGGISVYFSPAGGCTDAVVDRLAHAKQSIDVQAYSFTSATIAKAVSDAQARGVKVRVLLDASQRTAQYSSATFFYNQGIPTFIDAKHAIAHNKVMLIDGGTIITGSFNFTKAAEDSNAENLLIIDDKPDLYAAYAKNFSAHLSHAVKYEGPVPGRGGSERGPPQQQPAQQADPEATGELLQDAPVIAATPEPAKVDPIVHITRTGTKYHLAGCTYLRSSDIPVLLSVAKARGLTPCSVCRPPP